MIATSGGILHLPVCRNASALSDPKQIVFNDTFKALNVQCDSEPSSVKSYILGRQEHRKIQDIASWRRSARETSSGIAWVESVLSQLLETSVDRNDTC